MANGVYLQRRIQTLENEARERDAHADALERDAINERRAAERCRKGAEYLHKSAATP